MERSRCAMCSEEDNINGQMKGVAVMPQFYEPRLVGAPRCNGDREEVYDPSRLLEREPVEIKGLVSGETPAWRLELQRRATGTARGPAENYGADSGN